MVTSTTFMELSGGRSPWCFLWSVIRRGRQQLARATSQRAGELGLMVHLRSPIWWHRSTCGVCPAGRSVQRMSQWKKQVAVHLLGSHRRWALLGGKMRAACQGSRAFLVCASVDCRCKWYAVPGLGHHGKVTVVGRLLWEEVTLWGGHCCGEGERLPSVFPLARSVPLCDLLLLHGHISLKSLWRSHEDRRWR